MVAIPVSKLPYEELCVGDTIEYYLMVFGRGNPEGFRRSKILKIQPGEDHPVHVDTGDILWKLMKVTRVETASGHVIPRADRISRTIRTFHLVEGNLNLPTRLQIVGRNMKMIANEVVSTVYNDIRSGKEALAAHQNTSLRESEEQRCDFSAVEAVCSVESNLEVPSSSLEVTTDNPHTSSLNIEDLDNFPFDDENVMEGEFVDIKSGNSSQTGEDCALSVAPSSIQPISITNGMHFTSATLALYQVQAYALSTMKSVKIQRRGGVDSRIVCSGAANGGSCPFFVQLYKRRTGMWAISSMCLAHMDCVSVAKPTTKQIAQLPTFVSAVNADNTLSASALIALVSSRDGISLVGQERSVYRAKRMVMDLTLKGLKKSYQLIEPYFDAFKKMNPGSTAIMERDDQGRFLRAIVIVQSAVWSQNRNQRVLGIDCSHSKCQYYGGQQMHLVGRDGNMQNVTIAFALVPSEDIPSYTWFFDILDSHPIDIRGIPIFCDRSKAMLSVADSRGLNLKYCTAHIARNFVHEHSNVKEQHKVLVWGLQACYTESEYKSRLSWIEKELGSKAMTYLKNIPPERWCVFANIGVQPLYGWRTSNFVESVFGTQLTLGLRGLPPFDFIKAICSRIMSRTYKRSQAAAKWLSEGRSMTPAAMKVYESQSKEIGKYRVDPSSDDVYFVYNQQPSMQVGRRVTISKNHCTCGFMDQHCIPCRHLISVLKSRGELDLVFNHFAPYYQVSSYAEAFLGKSINLPLHEEIQRPDGVTKPPPSKKPLGRPPTKRKRSKGETETGGAAGTYHCKRCGQANHNIRTCRKVPT